jgi:hypothetical protein
MHTTNLWTLDVGCQKVLSVISVLDIIVCAHEPGYTSRLMMIVNGIDQRRICVIPYEFHRHNRQIT